MKIILKGGHLFDKKSGQNTTADLIVKEGKITEISGKEEQGDIIINCKGKYVTPAVIDLHTHCFPGSTNLGVDKNRMGLMQNIGIIADAGSAGTEHFLIFKKQVIEAPGTQVFEFINYSAIGLTQDKLELSREEFLDEETLEKTIRDNPDVIKGIKLRASASVVGTLGFAPIKRGLDFAHRIGLPAMIHIGNYPPSIEEVLEATAAGDIVTHIFHGKKGGILSAHGVKKEVWEARDRGVLFDVGHGSASFDFETAKRAVADGFLPDLISSDSHARNFGKTISGLSMVMDRLAECGMGVEQILCCVTRNAADALRLPNRIEAGSEARLNIISVDSNGRFSIEGLIWGETLRLGESYGKEGCRGNCE